MTGNDSLDCGATGGQSAPVRGWRSTLRETPQSLPGVLHSRQYTLDVRLVHSPLFRLRGALCIPGLWQRVLEVVRECGVHLDVREVQYPRHRARGVSNQIAV